MIADHDLPGEIRVERLCPSGSDLSFAWDSTAGDVHQAFSNALTSLSI